MTNQKPPDQRKAGELLESMGLSKKAPHQLESVGSEGSSSAEKPGEDESPTSDAIPSSRRHARAVADRLLPDVEVREALISATYRIAPRHQPFLRKIAERIADRRGGGRADVSEVIRLLIDRAIEEDG